MKRATTSEQAEAELKVLRERDITQARLIDSMAMEVRAVNQARDDAAEELRRCHAEIHRLTENQRQQAEELGSALRAQVDSLNQLAYERGRTISVLVKALDAAEGK